MVFTAAEHVNGSEQLDVDWPLLVAGDPKGLSMFIMFF